MPANSRWDLIRGLRVNQPAATFSQAYYLKFCVATQNFK